MEASLAQFSRLTERMREAVVQEDYDRVVALLTERGVVADVVQQRLTQEAAGKMLGKEGDRRRKELIIGVRMTSQRLADAINEKSSELIERLVGIQEMKSSQVYTMQGAGHGHRQGNK